MYKKILTSLILIVFLGCQGGAGSNITGPSTDSLTSGGSSGGTTASMSITQFDVTPTTILQNQQFKVHWIVSYSTPATGYTAEFHVNSEASLISGCSGCTRVFNANGDMSGSSYGKDVTVTGILSKNATGYYILFASPIGSRYLTDFDLTNTIYGILKACTYDSSMNQVCDTKTVQLKFT